MELYKFCITGYQDLEISQIPIPKIAEFLERLHVDIKRPLLITFLGF